MIKQQRLDKLEEKEKFLSTIEDILIEDKQVLDLIANTEIEKIESDEYTKYEALEHSDEDEQGEIFQMKLGNEDSDDEEYMKMKQFFLDSGCSRTSLRSRKHFSKLKETEGKTVNTANGKIQINYEGPSGPFEETHFIPTLKNNLISLGNSVNLGMKII